MRDKFVKSDRNHLSAEVEEDVIAYIQVLYEPLYEYLQIMAWSLENIAYRTLIMTKRGTSACVLYLRTPKH